VVVLSARSPSQLYRLFPVMSGTEVGSAKSSTPPLRGPSVSGVNVEKRPEGLGERLEKSSPESNAVSARAPREGVVESPDGGKACKS
jgi:hypothetical protein